MKSKRLAALMCAAVWGAGVTLVGQRDLPPVSYVCPMSEDPTLEDKPGTCPICRMDLVPVRIEQAFACPNHPAVISDKPGICPLDKRALMPVTVNLYWTCPDKPTVHLTEPGICSNGKPRTVVREDRAHGDHNPRHGGQFFMASDKWHHVEATHPRAGVLRVYFYDNFTKAIPPKGFAGRAVTKETWDAQAKQTREIEIAALRPSANGKTLDARINASTLPAKVTVKITFDPRLPEERFDFAFEKYSKEPAAAPGAPAGKPASAVARATTSTKASTSKPAPAPEATAPAQPSPVLLFNNGVDPTQTNGFEAARAAQVIPATAKEILALLAMRNSEISDLVGRGQFPAVYVPALLAKDVALALEAHGSELPDQRRMQAQAAIRRLVVAAWQLDSFGDLGDAGKVTGAYRTFASAIADLNTAYGAQ